MLVQAVRELADRRGLTGSVHADHEQDARLLGEREPSLSVALEHLRDGLLEPLEELGLAPGLALLEAADEVDRGGNSDVRLDQGLLDPLPRLLVGRVEEEILGERSPAPRKRFTEPPQPTLALLRFLGRP
jgi:hypothetical protein